MNPASDPHPAPYPPNPVLVRVRRGGAIESQHRGAWVLVDTAGSVLDGAGDYEAPYFVRSAIKSIQALPLVEGGAAERFAFSDLELALALSSHNAEALHTDGVRGLLERLGLEPRHLRCGAQTPGDPEARAALAETGAAPSALHNNCSGKHAAFLAQALHLGVAPEDYLDPEGPVQAAARQALAEMTDRDPASFETATDGCSAPTYRLPLRALATAFARVASPDDLPAPRRAACERMLAAVAAHPVAIAGRHKRLCTDLARLPGPASAIGGRLFPKIGAEAIYAVGLVGTGRALAVKLDDGAPRGLHATVVHLLERLSALGADDAALLERWRPTTLRNWAGLDVGELEVRPEGFEEHAP